MTAPKRHVGLDVMRSVAILLVLWEHFRFVPEAAWPDRRFYVPPDGVDVFFVLSGFLVGNIWLQNFDSTPGKEAVFLFWWRRIWRIWPLYYTFLFLNLTAVFLGVQPGQWSRGLISYFFFAQNLIKPVDLFFWESWSLCVEELFYFLLPVLFLVFKKRLRRLSAAAVLGCTACLMITIAWLYRWALPDSLDYDLWYRKMAPGRLDAIGWGVLMAAGSQSKVLKCFSTNKLRNLLLGGGGWGCAMAWGYIHLPACWQFVGPGLGPIFLACALLFFLNIQKLPQPLAWISEKVARWSYAAYLVHLSWVAWPLRCIMPVHPTLWEALGLLVAYGFVTFGLAALLHIGLEKYFLGLRQPLWHRLKEKFGNL
ncbi:MAG: acyltransferase [Flavobacteriales bacterium]|nr:acyltransferase [Flavobacteriales bacterium]